MMLKYKIPTLSYMIIMGCFTTLLFSSTLTSGNTMIIPQAAAQQREEARDDDELKVSKQFRKELENTLEEKQELVEEGKCTVRITLMRISYLGDNVGHEWHFLIQGLTSEKGEQGGKILDKDFLTFDPREHLDQGDFGLVEDTKQIGSKNQPTYIELIQSAREFDDDKPRSGFTGVLRSNDDVNGAGFTQMINCNMQEQFGYARLHVTDDQHGAARVAQIIFKYRVNLDP